MKDILITSSALILALLVIRRVFRGVLSRRFQYALWGLVLVRLLVPNSLLSTPAADFSVLTATAPVQNAVVRRLDSQIHYSRPQGQVSQAELSQRDIPVEYIPTAQDGFVLGESQGNGEPTTWLVRDPETNTVTRYNHMTVGPWAVLNVVWKVGMVLMGAFFLLSNLAFYGRLRKNRRVWRADNIRPYENSSSVGADVPIGPFVSRKIYLVPDGVIPSPCLFGRSIYITPAVGSDESKLRHVLAHESTHAKHLDPLWALLRCLCLTIYWFDPLVWVAAACSRTDCELACDESVLEALGEAERIPYGQTLLSLIPVKRAANPMLAATTMTAGKKQLADRVSRIAKGSRQFAAAALAVAVLAVAVSACTFTGAKLEATPEPAPTESQEPQGPRALTGEELRWFNEEFFNRNPNPAISYTYSIRNQFINSAFNLYDRPEDIDLYELFYVDGSFISDSEVSIIWNGDPDPDDLPCPAYKLTAEEIDEVLKQYTGLTLEQTNKVGLEHFIYQNDAYYWMHGDTNYPGDIEILCGTKDGSTVKLYHHGWNSGSQWYETTLEEQPDGGYWFISNRESEQPSIPTPLPAWGPEAVISLKNIEPSAAQAVSIEHRPSGDFVFSYENNLANWDIDGHHIRIYRSVDGGICAAEEQEDGAMNVFAQYSFNDVDMFFFHDLLGRDGFYITYRPGANSRFYLTDTDYYYFDGDGVLFLLARCHGESQIIDLDGDGQSELAAPRQIFFQRDGVVCEAQLDELLFEACPELEYWDYESWDRYGKYLSVHGYAEERDWTRYLYFDGENILVYKNEKPTTDHMVDGIDQGVPAQVAVQAKKFVSGLKWNEKDGTFANANYHHSSEARYDDWRVEAFYGPYTYSYGGRVVEAWQFNYEMHTVTPEQIVLAGGKYITEDDWVSPGYPGADTLFFLVDGDIRSYLNYSMVQESMDSYYVHELVLQLMEDQGVELTDGSTYAALEIESHLAQVLDHGDGQVYLQYADAESHGAGYTTDSSSGNAGYFRRYLTNPENYRWTRAESPGEMTGHASLLVVHSNWDCFLQFWEGSDLVAVKYMNQEPQWYRAESMWPKDDVFYYRSSAYYQARSWFDEAELAHQGEVAVPDRGQSPEEAAREFLELYELSRLEATPGSQYACTYAKIADLECQYPDPNDKSHFRFSYSLIFVPENENALNNMMAGNTGSYEGNDPDVPVGAFQYWRMGGMTLEHGYWTCSGTYTG